MLMKEGNKARNRVLSVPHLSVALLACEPYWVAAHVQLQGWSWRWGRWFDVWWWARVGECAEFGPRRVEKSCQGQVISRVYHRC